MADKEEGLQNGDRGFVSINKENVDANASLERAAPKKETLIKKFLVRKDL